MKKENTNVTMKQRQRRKGKSIGVKSISQNEDGVQSLEKDSSNNSCDESNLEGIANERNEKQLFEHASVLEKNDSETDSDIQKIESKSYRNNLGSFMKFINDISIYLKPEHLEILRCTPFWNFIELFIENKLDNKDIKKNSECVDAVVQMYKPDSGKFEIGKELLDFDEMQMKEIFGIPTKGAVLTSLPQIEKKYLPPICLNFIKKYLFDNEKINKRVVERYIYTALKQKDKESAEDVVRFIIMHLLCTFFFSGSNSELKWSYLPYVVDFDEMRHTNWAKSILVNLKENLKRNAANPRRNNSCVTVLLYWICDRVEIIEERESYKEGMPTVAKWRLNDLNDKLTYKFLHNLDGDKVKRSIACPKGNTSEVDEEFSEIMEDLKRENMSLKKKVDQLESENEELKKKIKTLQSNSFVKEVEDTLDMDKDISFQQKNLFTYDDIEEDEAFEDNTNRNEGHDASCATPIAGMDLCVEHNTDVNEVANEGRPIVSMDLVVVEHNSDVNEVENEERPIVSMDLCVEHKMDVSVEENKGENEKKRRLVKESEKKKKNHYLEKKERKRSKKDGNKVTKKKVIEEDRETNKVTFLSPIVPPKPMGKLEDTSIFCHLQQKQIDHIQTFYKYDDQNLAVYENYDDGIKIMGSELNDILTGDCIDCSVIHWFEVTKLRPRYPNNFYVRPEDTNCILLDLKSTTQTLLAKELEERIVRYHKKELGLYKIFLPICHQQSHWTLLVLDYEDLQWSHYNSVKPISFSRWPYAEEILKVQKYIKDTMEDIWLGNGILEMEYGNGSNIECKDCPQQQQKSLDCGIYVMKYMENISTNEWLPEAFSKTQIEKMRAEIACELFDSNKYSWSEVNHLSVIMIQDELEQERRMRKM